MHACIWGRIAWIAIAMPRRDSDAGCRILASLGWVVPNAQPPPFLTSVNLQLLLIGPAQNGKPCHPRPMRQSSMNISLPESLRSYVESHVESGAYSTPSEFVRDLIRRDREQGEIQQKLLEGLQSPSVPVGKDFWNNVRRAAHARAKTPRVLQSRPGRS